MLTDSFGRRHVYLRLSVTDRCNLRCTYCMPKEGIELDSRDEMLTFEEIERLVRLFAVLGVVKVRITGGEPTVRKGLVELVERIDAIRGIETIALTTNGVLLDGLAQPLQSAGVSILNVSLDTLERERYKEITGFDELQRVRAGLARAMQAGFAALKINTVVIAGLNDDEVLAFAELTRDDPLSVRFIEYMPFAGNGWDNSRYIPYQELLSRIASKFALAPIARARRVAGVAKDFAIKGFAGTVSFITPVTDRFCGACNRLRITSDGKLKTCLYSPAHLSLRDAMRDGAADDELCAMIMRAVQDKPLGHTIGESDLNAAAASLESMVEIGG